MIDPLRSRTAARADWHIRPRPGSDAALALGMIHQLIEMELIDADYVAEHTLGFDALKARAAKFSLERTAEITGISSDDIAELARTYGEAKQSAIRTGVALERTRNGPDAVRAVSCLPALTGAWRHKGGGYFQHPQAHFPIRRDRLTRPDFVEEGRRAIDLFGIADALVPDNENPIKALFVYNANPITASGDQERTVKGLTRDDLFTVVSEIFPTDATDYADIVLPATSQLEQLDLMYSWGHFNVQLNQPAIEPLGEAISNTELFRRLSSVMGFDDADLHRSDETLLRDALDWKAAQLGGCSLDELYENGFARLKVGDPAERLPHADGAFPTPSGRCEFVSSMAGTGGAMIEVYRQGFSGSEPGGAVDPLPQHVEIDADPQHPFVLLSPKTHHFLNSGYANLAAGSEQQPLWLHPDDAARLGLTEGDMARVANDRGEVAARVRVTDDTLPGVVVVTHGYWRKHVGGATVNALVSHRPAAIGRAITVNDTRVSIGALAE